VIAISGADMKRKKSSVPTTNLTSRLSLSELLDRHVLHAVSEIDVAIHTDDFNADFSHSTVPFRFSFLSKHFTPFEKRSGCEMPANPRLLFLLASLSTDSESCNTSANMLCCCLDGFTNHLSLDVQQVQSSSWFHLSLTNLPKMLCESSYLISVPCVG
jgi:hypothetical protein